MRDESAGLGHRLNIGCGSVYLREWTNLDCISTAPCVRAHDLKEGVPHADDSFEVVYHSHVLEHLAPGEAEYLTCECRRVLKTGGILRVVVPDLESKARLYLEKLENAEAEGSRKNLLNYQWAVIEMIDQMVRRRTGGIMADYLRQEPLPEYAGERLGEEVARVRRTPPASAPPGWVGRQKIRFRRFRECLGMCLCDVHPHEKEMIDFFRQGECHQWMYDRFSLGELLKKCGFTDIEKCTAMSSTISDWEKNGRWLDAPDGKIRRPDSLYMEARKP